MEGGRVDAQLEHFPLFTKIQQLHYIQKAFSPQGMPAHQYGVREVVEVNKASGVVCI